jgi:hypothetical protein
MPRLAHAALLVGSSMTIFRSRMQDSAEELMPDPQRSPRHQAMVLFTEQELERALLDQTRPTTGMYAHPSAAEHAAVQRAVHTICLEAHRLDLRAEELLVGIKQAWSQLAHVRARQLGDRDGDVLREVVSRSIELFFEARDESTEARRA